MPAADDGRAAILSSLMNLLEKYREGVKVKLESLGGVRIASFTVPPGTAGPAPADRPFVMTPGQKDIMAALEHKALKAEALARKVGLGNKSKLYEPGSLKGLTDRGLVVNVRGVGYYRPDAPPPELARSATVADGPPTVGDGPPTVPDRKGD